SRAPLRRQQTRSSLPICLAWVTATRLPPVDQDRVLRRCRTVLRKRATIELRKLTVANEHPALGINHRDDHDNCCHISHPINAIMAESGARVPWDVRKTSVRFQHVIVFETKYLRSYYFVARIRRHIASLRPSGAPRRSRCWSRRWGHWYIP